METGRLANRQATGHHAGKKVAGIKHYIAAAPVVPEMLSPVIA